MSKTYIVAPGLEFSYPADTVSLSIIENSGGFSKLTEEQKKYVKIKTVKSGEDCSDMPKKSLQIYLERGWVLNSEVVKSEDEIIAKIQAEELAEEGKV